MVVAPPRRAPCVRHKPCVFPWTCEKVAGTIHGKAGLFQRRSQTRRYRAVRLLPSAAALSLALEPEPRPAGELSCAIWILNDSSGRKMKNEECIVQNGAGLRQRSPAACRTLSRARERWLLLVMAAIQFTTNLDFLIILPLGPQYMRLMHLTPAQFNLIVAAYAIAAGISGVVAGFCLDRFDRKNALLGLFLGFATGTLLCALAPSYPLLVAARALAGAFGGVDRRGDPGHCGRRYPGTSPGQGHGPGYVRVFGGLDFRGAAAAWCWRRILSWHVPFYAIAGLGVPILLAVTLRPAACAVIWALAQGAPSTGAGLGGAGGAEPPDGLCFHGGAGLAAAFDLPHVAPYMVQNAGLTEKQVAVHLSERADCAPSSA